MIELRRVCSDDVGLLWEWANDPAVREASFSSEPIPWDVHVAWFNDHLDDTSTFLYIALDTTGTPIGQIRFRIEDSEAIVSVSLAAGLRERGLGTQVIMTGTERLFQFSHVKLVHAFIKEDNIASIRAFERCGYHRGGFTVIKNHKALDYVKQRDT